MSFMTKMTCLIISQPSILKNRGYLNGFLDRLKALESEGAIEILGTHRTFGSLFHDGYTLLVWKPLWSADRKGFYDMKMYDKNGNELDFFFEMSKYAGYLHKSHVSRHLALYELYKKTADIPGSIIELGIFNGSTYFYLARLLETFNASQLESNGSTSKNLYGFDTFTGFPELTKEDDSGKNFKHCKVGGLKGAKETFFDLLDEFKENSAIGNRLHVVEGDICETLPEFLKKNASIRYSMVLFDMDIYKPTKVSLDLLYDLIVPGGVLVFDDYGLPEWAGETQAVDEFIAKHKLKLQHFPWTFAPSAYCIKE